jgi:uncharacterized protein YndB with AHSA1/START domain
MSISSKLEIVASGERDLVMTRVFHAPAQLVYAAHTQPELVKRWLGIFGGWALPVCEIDLRVGGSARYVWRHSDGREMGMTQTYREIVANERIVSSEAFDTAWYEGECVGTLTLRPENGKTLLTNTLRYASKQVRDAVLASPMEKGVAASYDKLAEIVLVGAAQI